MTGKHWVAIGMFLGGAGLAISGLHSWSEALSTSFVAGALVQTGGAVVALFSEKPGEK